MDRKIINKPNVTKSNILEGEDVRMMRIVDVGEIKAYVLCVDEKVSCPVFSWNWNEESMGKEELARVYEYITGGDGGDLNFWGLGILKTANAEDGFWVVAHMREGEETNDGSKIRYEVVL